MELSKCPKCDKKPTNAEKWKYTLLTTLIFILVVHPMTYKLVQKLLGNIIGKIADIKTGCPTMLGIFVHTVVFTLLLRYIMDLDI